MLKPNLMVVALLVGFQAFAASVAPAAPADAKATKASGAPMTKTPATVPSLSDSTLLLPPSLAFSQLDRSDLSYLRRSPCRWQRNQRQARQALHMPVPRPRTRQPRWSSAPCRRPAASSPRRRAPNWGVRFDHGAHGHCRAPAAFAWSAVVVCGTNQIGWQ